MRAHSIDAKPPVEASSETPRQRPRRTDWRLGGSTVRDWRESALAVAGIGLGLGILAGMGAIAVFGAAGAAASVGALWLGMAASVVWALSRSRPIGLLRFRAVDLIWGLGLGLVLRLVQGWLEGADRLPSLPTLDGVLPSGWWFTDLLAPAVIAPVVEEFFFRGVILVAVYTMLRRPFGRAVAGVAAVVVSTAVFLIAHSLIGALSIDRMIALTLVGLVCGALVMLTGRIWSAVLLHVVYNATGALLVIAGTVLA